MDHVIPLSKGGPHTEGNCRTAHWTCNAKKYIGEPESVTKPPIDKVVQHIVPRPTKSGKRCRVNRCPREVKTASYCGPHYHRLRKYDDPLAVKCGCGCGEILRVKPDFFGILYMSGHGIAGKPLSPEEKLRENLKRQPVSEYGREAYGVFDDCLVWTGPKNPQGYGKLYVGVPGMKRRGKTYLAHRLAYILAYGPDSVTNLSVDHLCYVPLCCNPNHLEAVTLEENVRRAGERVTHCPKGHEYSGGNVDSNEHGHRRCRQCNTDRYHMEILGHEFVEDLAGTSMKRRSCRVCNEVKAKTASYCPQGHEYDEGNTRIGTDGKKYCVQCTLDRTHIPQFGHAFEVDVAHSSPKRRRCRICMDSAPTVTHCVQGHEYNELTLEFTGKGHRRCALCRLGAGHKEKTGHDYVIELGGESSSRRCATCRLDKESTPQFCPAGHEFTTENTFYKNGWRNCRACNFNRAHLRDKGHEFENDPNFVSSKIRRCRICYERRVASKVRG
ncbi:HNH endonuclease [Nocardia sp. NPDC057663]|uniref:HNH endonuclease n=1 Tax=Nocardia sp. NPDC057663 TaxID=3346201 RepID=UPI00366A66CC